MENNNYESGTISQGNDEDHVINVPAGTKEIKVMVYWHDKEASTNASIALVNDLDITLTSPTGTISYPWVLDPTPNSSILNTPASRNGILHSGPWSHTLWKYVQSM